MAGRQLPAQENLLDRLRAFAGKRVLILADLVADRFVTGIPKRISREAPVLILRETGALLCPGGGANAAANVAALGGVPLLVGVVGEDASGRGLLEALAERRISTAGIATLPGWVTPTKSRILAGFPSGSRQQVVRLDREPAGELPEAAEAAIDERLAQFSGQAAVAVISDYGYGAAHPKRVPRLRRCLLDPDSDRIVADSRFRLLAFRDLQAATPNLEEAEGASGRDLTSNRQALEQGGRELRKRLGLEFLVITRGSQGMSVFFEGRECHIPVSGTDQVADVTGAGDTVIGTLALALAAGADPVEAALLANYAGGVVVMKAGTATLEPSELAEAIERDSALLERVEWVEY